MWFCTDAYTRYLDHMRSQRTYDATMSCRKLSTDIPPSTQSPASSDASSAMRNGPHGVNGAHVFASMVHNEENVDFANIALYVPAIQLAGTLIAATSCLLLCGWLLQGGGCAVRSATLCTLVCTAGLWRKVRMHYARGADNVFDALRPAALIWLVSIIAEHLVSACAIGSATGHAEATSLFSRNTVFHTCVLVMIAAGLIRAWTPESENDYPFGLSAVALLVVAMLPPTPHPTDRGPLCATVDGFDVGERYLRTVCFAFVYTCLVYAAPPSRHGTSDTVLCVCRAAGGSIWTLGCVVHLLVIAPVQCAMIIWLRINGSPIDNNVVDTVEDVDCEEEGYNGASCVPSVGYSGRPYTDTSTIDALLHEERRKAHLDEDTERAGYRTSNGIANGHSNGHSNGHLNGGMGLSVAAPLSGMSGGAIRPSAEHMAEVARRLAEEV